MSDRCVPRGRALSTQPRTERGAVAVEFALVLPLLVMLLLGVTTAGLSYTHSIGLTNAVREGARFGAITPATDPAAWRAGVIARVRSTQFDDNLTTPQTAVCVQLFKQNSGAVANTFQCSNGAATILNLTSAPTPPNVGVGKCVVQVWAARPFTINVAIAPAWNRTITRTSVTRYERDTC